MYRNPLPEPIVNFSVTGETFFQDLAFDDDYGYKPHEGVDLHHSFDEVPFDADPEQEQAKQRKYWKGKEANIINELHEAIKANEWADAWKLAQRLRKSRNAPKKRIYGHATKYAPHGSGMGGVPRTFRIR